MVVPPSPAVRPTSSVQGAARGTSPAARWGLRTPSPPTVVVVRTLAVWGGGEGRPAGDGGVACKWEADLQCAVVGTGVGCTGSADGAGRGGGGVARHARWRRQQRGGR